MVVRETFYATKINLHIPIITIIAINMLTIENHCINSIHVKSSKLLVAKHVWQASLFTVSGKQEFQNNCSGKLTCSFLNRSKSLATPSQLLLTRSVPIITRCRNMLILFRLFTSADLRWSFKFRPSVRLLWTSNFYTDK